jgi:hypothetical protein
MKSFIYVIAFLLFLISVPAGFAVSDGKVELTVNVIDGIRTPVPYPGHIEIYFLGDSNETIILKDIVVDWGNKNITRIALNKTLVGVGSEYRKLRDISSVKNINDSTKSDISELSMRISEGTSREKIVVDPGKIFDDGFEPRKEKTIYFELFYIYNNESKVIHEELVLKILPQIIEPQVKVNKETAISPISISSVPQASDSYYYGDLHVHSGYSTLIGGYDDVPITGDECGYELEAWYGSTIPELRNQSQALGLDWLSITDHSYCLDPVKFSNVQDWSLGNSTSDFIIIPSEEVSVDDIPDDGSDGEPFCNYPNDDNVAHLGGHGISSFISGGMCNDQLNAQQGIDEVKRLGGFPIINHPWGGDWQSIDTDAWDWEANLSTNGETGVEIWNGATPDEGSINFWVSRLLRGLKTYAFSGTDRHDAASDEVVDGVYVPGTFDKVNLIEALNKGHVFVSNAPFLALKSRTDPNLMMGDTITIRSGDAVEFSVSYNPQSSGRLTVHKGVIGKNSEDNESGWPKTYDISGAGEIIFSDTPDKKSYYRAHYAATDDSDFIAFTNPIWVEAENIIISEVYYDDIIQSNAEWDYEWVEFYNPTTTEIETGGWRIETKSYSGAIRNFTIPSGYPTKIAPKSYFVIADSENGFFERYSIAPSFVYHNSTNSSLGPGKNPACLRLHNTGASLSILNENNELVDRIEWGLGEEGDLNKNDNAPDCEPGYSLQRIITGFDSGNSSYDFSCNIPTPFS